jgi:plastocyanin
VKSIAAYAATLAVLGFTVVILGWMFARVAEHPGVPRETGVLPSWFTGTPPVAGVATEKPGASAAPAQAKAGPTDGDYKDFANGEIEIDLKEYEFVPSRIRTRPGTVVFVLRNAGRFAHDFHVEGPGFEVYAEKFSPGRTVRVQAVMQEGEYKVSCPLSNHDERGMHGKLIVTSKLAGS